MNAEGAEGADTHGERHAQAGVPCAHAGKARAYGGVMRSER